MSSMLTGGLGSHFPSLLYRRLRFVNNVVAREATRTNQDQPVPTSSRSQQQKRLIAACNSQQGQVKSRQRHQAERRPQQEKPSRKYSTWQVARASVPSSAVKARLRGFHRYYIVGYDSLTALWREKQPAPTRTNQYQPAAEVSSRND